MGYGARTTSFSALGLPCSPGQLHVSMSITKRQFELYSEVWKLCYQSCSDVPELPPSAMMQRQTKATCKKAVYKTYSSSFCLFVYKFKSVRLSSIYSYTRSVKETPYRKGREAKHQPSRVSCSQQGSCRSISLNFP